LDLADNASLNEIIDLATSLKQCNNT
jgi:hypothetical protein